MLISIFHFESQNQAKYQKRGYIKMVDSSKFSDVMLQRRNAIRSFCQHHSQHHSWRPAHYLLSLTLSKSKSKLQSAVERYQNPSQENVGGRLQYERWLCRPSRKVVPLDRKNITNITNGRGTWSQEHYKWHHITSGGLHLKTASQVPSEPFWWKYSNRSALMIEILYQVGAFDGHRQWKPRDGRAPVGEQGTLS